jgi:type IV pilus assembly protein PilX
MAYRSEAMVAERFVAYCPPPHRGVALIIGLIILAVLSLIGVAAFTISTQEERMAGNSRDRIRAFEAAEAALRECEYYVKSGNAKFDGTDGTYLAPAPPGATMAETIKMLDQTSTPTGTVYSYQSTLNPEWSSAPICIAEQFQVQRGNKGKGYAIPVTNVDHITARGYGSNPNTVVMLETYYAEP